jgi:hypothetical protein
MNTAQKIAEAIRSVDLAEQSEFFITEEWDEAVSLLPDDVNLSIPLCVHDLIKDEMGAIVLEDRYDAFGNRRDIKTVDGKEVDDPDWEPKPKRRIRYDVFAILAWIAAKRDEPELALDEVRKKISGDVFDEIYDDVMYFWGFDMPKLRKIQAERESESSKESEPVNP